MAVLQQLCLLGPPCPALQKDGVFRGTSSAGAGEPCRGAAVLHTSRARKEKRLCCLHWRSRTSRSRSREKLFGLRKTLICHSQQNAPNEGDENRPNGIKLQSLFYEVS